MPKKSFSLDVKILALQHLEEGRHTLEEICTMFSVNMTTLYVWRALYQYGESEALMRSKKNKLYSEDYKQCAVEDYQTGNYSMFHTLLNYLLGTFSTSPI